MSKPKQGKSKGGKVTDVRSSLLMLAGCIKKRDYYHEQLLKLKPGRHNKDARKRVREQLSNENRRLREIQERLEGELETIEKDYQGETKELLTILSKEKEVIRLMREGSEIAKNMRGSLASMDIDRIMAKYDYDFFVCHASEDKDEVARPISEHLSNLGYRVWYDEFTLSIGDSLRESITHGLATSRFGIVILSNAFFQKRWPSKELNGLFQRSLLEPGVILPLLHHISFDEVRRQDPMIADTVMLNTSSLSLVQVAQKLHERFERGQQS